MIERIYFCSCTTYHLTVCLYYAISVNWRQDQEKVLVWLNTSKNNIEIEKFKDCFDQIIEISDYTKQEGPYIQNQFNKIKTIGWLFPFSKVGKLCKEHGKRHIVVAFNDTEGLTSQLIRSVTRFSNSMIILIEEGLGLYMPNYHKNLSLYSKIGNVIRGIRVPDYIGGNTSVQTIIAKDPEKLPLFQTEGRAVIRQNNLFIDKRWIKKSGLGDILTLESTRINCQPSIIWIGQPLSQDLAYENYEMNILQSIFEAIRLRTSYEIYIKAHPREPLNKYESFIDKYNLINVGTDELSWLPVELLMNVISPSVVLTPFSSAGKNISAMGIKCKIIYCYKMFGLEFKDDFRRTGALDYNDTYEVKSIGELLNVLDIPLSERKPEVCLLDEDITFFSKI